MTSQSLNQDWFNAAVAALPAGSLSTVRQQAAQVFSAAGFPTVQHEDWKYTSLATAADVSNAWLREYPANGSAVAQLPKINAAVLDDLTQIDADWIIVRNGALDSESLQKLALQTGLTIDRFTDTDLSGNERMPDIAVDTPMSAFNAALLQDGVHVRVAAAVAVKRPLGILCIDDPSHAVSQTRLIIEAGENSSLQVIEYTVSNSRGDQFTNSVVQIDIAAGANVDHIRLQNRDSQHIATNRLVAQLAADARFSNFALDVGGGLTRNDIVAGINGKGGSVQLYGLYLAAGEQHIDNHTRVEHRVGPATSHEAYRGILGGRSRCVFNGQAIVFAGADGTDANQENHNLLLSEHAEIDTKPELEIYADDVKCSHGATVGQLDDAAMFYLLSRGLDASEARQLLTRSFAASLLDQVTIEAARAFVQKTVDASLAALLEQEPS